MAHNLATILGRVAMAYQGETPWHKLGTRLTGCTDLDEMLRVSSLDWSVELRDLFLADGATVDDTRAVVRDVDQQYLGSVGIDYGVLQNRDAFAPLRDMVTDHGCTIESAGALGRGERVWMLTKLPTSADIVPGDTLRDYFLITSGHTGRTGYAVKPTRVRVVCQNTLDLAIGTGTNLISMRHTSTIEARAASARTLVTQLAGIMAASTDVFKRFAETRMSPVDVASYIDTILPLQKDSDVITRRRETIASLVWTGQGAQLAGSNGESTTLWAAYNAISEYTDHVRPAEAKNANAKQSANESAIFGLSAQLKLKALQTATRLIAAS